MGKFMNLCLLPTLLGVVLAARTASAGRQRHGHGPTTYRPGIVLSDSVKHLENNGIEGNPPGSDDLAHQDQAYVVGAGYKISDGVLDGSFGGVTHTTNGIRYGYDHEGPHHSGKDYQQTPYELEFKESDPGTPSSIPQSGKGYEITHAKGYSVYEDSPNALHHGHQYQFHFPGGHGYQYFQRSHSHSHSPNSLSSSASHGGGTKYVQEIHTPHTLPQESDHFRPIMYDAPAPSYPHHPPPPHYLRRGPPPPSSRFPRHYRSHHPHHHPHPHPPRHPRHFLPPHVPPHRPMPLLEPHPNPNLVHDYPLPPPPPHHNHPHHLQPAPSNNRLIGFRGYGLYSPAYRQGLSHSPTHSGYGYFG